MMNQNQYLFSKISLWRNKYMAQSKSSLWSTSNNQGTTRRGRKQGQEMTGDYPSTIIMPWLCFCKWETLPFEFYLRVLPHIAYKSRQLRFHSVTFTFSFSKLRFFAGASCSSKPYIKRLLSHHTMKVRNDTKRQNRKEIDRIEMYINMLVYTVVLVCKCDVCILWLVFVCTFYKDSQSLY